MLAIVALRHVRLLLIAFAVTEGDLRDFLVGAVLNDQFWVVLAYLQVSGVASRVLPIFVLVDCRRMEVGYVGRLILSHRVHLGGIRS